MSFILVDTIDNAVKHAVEARKDRNTDADNAFTFAEEELRHYAKRYHPGYKFVSVRFTTLCYRSEPKLPRAVLGDTQNIIRVAAKEDNDIMKTQSLLPWQSNVGSDLTNIRRKSDLSNMFEASERLARALPASQDSFSNPNISH